MSKKEAKKYQHKATLKEITKQKQQLPTHSKKKFQELPKITPPLQTSDTRDGLTTSHIGDMNKGIVESGIDVGNTEHLLSGADILGAELDLFLLGTHLLLSTLLVGGGDGFSLCVILVCLVCFLFVSFLFPPFCSLSFFFFFFFKFLSLFFFFLII